jgi:hypothetical protein
MWVDPLGLEINVVGTSEYQDEILIQLNLLVDHKLAINSDGTVYITEYASEKTQIYSKGNALIERMLENDKYSTTIKERTYSDDPVRTIYPEEDRLIRMSTDSENRSGANAQIYFDVYYKSFDVKVIIDPNSGIVVGTDDKIYNPEYIILGHELIHADRVMRGVEISSFVTTSYEYLTDIEPKKFLFIKYDKAVHKEEGPFKVEEYITIGLKDQHKVKDNITENDIRLEHNLPLRGAYSAD